MRRRTLLPALLALVLVLPALAPAGSTGPRALAVSASLGGCGTDAEGISCRIDVSWSPVEGAERYTIAVTRPDGAVLELGSSRGTSATVWVPYGGAGSYGVTVTAWGEEGEDGKAKPIASGDAKPGDGAGERAAGAESQPASEPPADADDQAAPEPDPEPQPTPEPGSAPQSQPAPEPGSAPQPQPTPPAETVPADSSPQPQPAPEANSQATSAGCPADEGSGGAADARC